MLGFASSSLEMSRCGGGGGGGGGGGIHMCVVV